MVDLIEIIQYNGKKYSLANVKNNEIILDKHCSICRYTGIFEKVLKESPGQLVFINNPEELCLYKPDKNIYHWLSYYSREEKGKIIEFAARYNPCVINEGFIKVLIESSKLKPLDLNLDLTYFPYIKDVHPNTKSEIKALAIYQESLPELMKLVPKTEKFFLYTKFLEFFRKNLIP